MEKIKDELLVFFEPVLELFEEEFSVHDFDIFLKSSGVDIQNLNDENFDRSIGIIKELISFLKDIKELINNKEKIDSEEVLNIYNNGFEIFNKFEEIKDLDGLAGVVFKKILDTLISDYLAFNYPKIFEWLRFLKVIEPYVDEKLDNLFYEVKINRILQFLKTPQNWYEEAYLWKNEKFKAEELVTNLHSLLSEFGFFTYYSSPKESADYSNIVSSNGDELFQILKAPIALLLKNHKFVESGIEVFPTRTNQSDNYDGIAISPYGLLEIGNAKEFDNNWDLDFSASYSVENPISYAVLFDETKFISRDGNFVELSDVYSKFSIIKTRKTKEETTENEENEKSVITINDVGFGVEAFSSSKGFEYGVFGMLREMEILIASDKADSFLKKYIPDGINAKFDLTIGWSSDTGLYFNNNASLDLVLPINKKYKTFELKEIALFLGSNNPESIEGIISTSFAAELGPIHVEVERIGLKSTFEINSPAVSFFKAQLPSYSPPLGIKLEVDQKFVTGTGYYRFFPDTKEYAGVLNLNFKKVEVAALGLITTRLPNNQDGFSMLAIISATFPGIELGFGFKLKGLGGLIGVNRTFKVDALRERMVSGAIGSIMFPTITLDKDGKIERGATDKYISDLRSIFPVKEKHYVIAPFLRLGWGSGKSIELDLGVLIELPFKNRVILLGSLGIYIPNKKKVISEIHVDVLGDFNFAEKYIRIEGILRNSHIKNIPLQGGFAFVLGWGSQPQFLFSVGGYHPAYKKPKSFPEIPRLSAVLKKGKWTITLAYYTAITSNTFQLGYRADFEFKKKRTKAVGYFSFDTLIQFDPFYFIAEIGMGIDIKHRRWRFAAQLHFMLSGPKPWRVKGYGRFKICGFKVKIKFDKTWGGKKQDELPPSYIETIDLLKKVEKELCLPDSWSANLPQNFSTLDTLRSLEESEEQLLIVHPSGYLEVRQQAIPLKTIMERNGEELTREKIKVELIAVSLNGTTLEGANDTKEYFAITQFHTLNDAEKIDAKDFELFPAGKAFNGVEEFAFHETDIAEKKFGYDEPIYPKNGEPELQARPTSKSVSAAGGISIDPINWRKSKRKMRRRIRKNNDAYRFKVLDDMPKRKKEYFAVMERTQLVDPGQMIEIIALGGFNNRYSAYETRAEALIELKSKKEGLEKWQITTIDEELFKLYSKAGLPV